MKREISENLKKLFENVLLPVKDINPEAVAAH